jgi:hypothetical protein
VTQGLGSFFLEGTLSSNVTIKSPMKSSVVERSRVSLEDAFWKSLQETILSGTTNLCRIGNLPICPRPFASLPLASIRMSRAEGLPSSR